MDLQQAYETLGLAHDADPEEIEVAYRRLRNDLETRLERVSATSVRARFHELRTRLDAARMLLLTTSSPGTDEPLTHAFQVLGLAPGASALDVASAYVTLCEEIEREAGDASTEELRRACLEARADVDAAYQQCALLPLQDQLSPESSEGEGNGKHYETQMSTTPFEAAPTEGEAVGEDGPDVLRIDPAADSEERPPRRRRGRRLARAFAVAASLVLLLVGGGFAAAQWYGVDVREVALRFMPPSLLDRFEPEAPVAEIAEAKRQAEYLRGRVAEERRDLEARVEEARLRSEELERRGAAAEDPAERERLAAELAQARTRRDLSSELADLAERHVFASPEMAVAYGKIELAGEQLASGASTEALVAFSEARSRLEEALQRLDVAEQAVGARSEAEAGLEAWRALAEEAGLEELPAAADGRDVLEIARAILSDGLFEEAAPELRRAAQHFSAAIAEGRKRIAASRTPAEEALLAAAAETDRPDPPVERPPEPPRDAEVSESDPLAPVSAAPPDRQRAAIKLVQVPAGEFFYGCNQSVDQACGSGEEPGRQLALDAFRIDRTEVRVNEYRVCVEAGACTPPENGPDCNWNGLGRGDHPVNCVDWYQAAAYCAWVGKRLPSEREWEKAARGTDGRVYPWGNDAPSCSQAVIAEGDALGCGEGSTWPVATREVGRSPFGLFDMAGNVLEWTSDAAGLDGSERVVRGGSWRSRVALARVSSRESLAADSRDPRVGLRCALDDAVFAATFAR